MSYSELLDGMVKDLGGCGRQQWITAFIGQAGKAICTFSMLAMTFNRQQPDFRCIDISTTSSQLSTNATEGKGFEAVFDNQCEPRNLSHCQGYVFDDNMHTVVDEWSLVCDDKWKVAIITTIQMVGVLVGCFISGHLGDFIGRKPTYFLSLAILVIFNVVAYFAVNWQMYAGIRFVLGIGIGFYLTVHYNVMLEFVPTQWRARIIAVPAWSFAGGFFALVVYLLKDWKNLHLFTAAIGLPFLLTYCIVQESVRWLITKGRYDAAEKVFNHIADTNHKELPDCSKIIKQAAEYSKDTGTEHYSVLYLFKAKDRTILTLGLMFIWMSISYSYYGLTFGVNSLAGDLYVNMFLMNIIEAPASFSIMYLVNKFGRKRCCIFFFLFTTVCGFTVGLIQYVDTPHRGLITNVFALSSKMGIAVGWGCLIVYTSELYPTVVRTIAYGLHNTTARIGSIVAPQVVFLNDSIPGLMYFISACLMLISGLLCCLFPDTKNKVLQDTYHEYRNPYKTGIVETTEKDQTKL